jgi:CheY-like chemotaxis protein
MYADILLNQNGFNSKEMNFLTAQLKYLKDIAPSDGTCSADFVKDKTFFKGMVKIKSAEGLFSAECCGTSLQDLNTQICASMESQIREWKSERFHLFALPPVSHHFKKVKRALVVDDDIDMVRFISQQLKREECRVEFCTDGYDALEKLVSKNYDLVIMDWSLPGISGGEVLRKTDEFIDMDPLTSEKWGVDKKPVVIVSGHDINKLHFPLVEKFKIVDFWSKQIGPSALVSKVKNVAQQNFSIA